MKKITMLEPEESKKQCYILVNGLIKYDPAWLTQKDKLMSHDKFIR